MAPKKIKPTIKTASSVKNNPMEDLIKKRREFFTSLQTRIVSLPDKAAIPAMVGDDIRAYARSQGSEKALMKATDCNVGQLNQLMEFLLQPPHLSSLSLDSLIQKFMSSLVIEEELGLETNPLEGLLYDERIRYRIRKYTREHLSSYIADLPDDAERTDRKMNEVKKDLASLFPEDNPFDTLFESFIPEPYIKTWLVETDFVVDERVDVRSAVRRFIQEHRFHLIKDLLEKGYEPKSAHDWEKVVGAEFFERFPLDFWKMSVWTEFERFNQEIQKFSISIADYFRLLHESKEHDKKLIRVEEIKHGKKSKARLVLLSDVLKKDRMGEEDDVQPKKNLLRMPTDREMALNLRIRADLGGFVAHLLTPIGHDGAGYIGESFDDTRSYATDRFYKDRVSSSLFEDGHVVLTSDMYDPPRSFAFRVCLLFSDGRIEHQTKTLYQQEQKYLSQERGVQLPRFRQHILTTPLENLAQEDIDKIRTKIRGDLSVYLNGVLTQKLNTDTMAQEIESVFTRCNTMDDYLGRMFRVFLMINPRYEFTRLFPQVRRRLNLFFYKLTELGDLPDTLLFPRLVAIAPELQDQYRAWYNKNELVFKQEIATYLILERYRYIRVPPQHFSQSAPPSGICATETTENYTFLFPYKKKFLDLTDLADACSSQDVLVDGQELPSSLMDMLRTFLNVDMVRLNVGAFLEETGYELSSEPSGIPAEQPIQIAVSADPQQPAHQQTSLPLFRDKAFQFLDSMLSHV